MKVSSKTLYYTISPKKAAISSLKAGKKNFTVKMSTKVSSTGGSNYKIGYRVKGGSWKYKTTTAQSLTVSGLTAGKTYEVKVCAYKSNYTGSWSATKTVKPTSK